jgi:hypothetical protein
MFKAENIPGMLIGLVVIVGATWLLVRDHLARERDEAAMARDADEPSSGSQGE